MKNKFSDHIKERSKYSKSTFFMRGECGQFLGQYFLY